MEGNGCTVKCELEEVAKEEDSEEENVEILKKRISSHRLYGLLMESHLNCLKASLGNQGENLQTNIGSNAVNRDNLKLGAANVERLSELDQFMEAYCLMLGNLKEVMEKPIAETNRFINSMHEQLNELTGTNLGRSPISDSDKDN